MNKRGKWLALSCAFTLLFLLGSTASAAVPSDAKRQIMYDSFGNAFAQIFEQAAGIPAGDIGTMAGYFSAGDFSNGFLTAGKIATDTAIGLVSSTVGTAIFVAKLEAAVITIGKAYLDAYMIDIFWNVFKNLPETDQDNWLAGNDDPQLSYGLGAYYTERNVEDLRDLFGYYRNLERQKEVFMQKAAQVMDDLNKAEYMSEPELIRPLNTELEYSAGITLEWWANYGNYFRVDITVGGQSASTIVKFPTYEISPTVALSAFGLNFEEILQDATEPVTVTWKVQSARYDSTGLIETMVGASYVAGVNKLVSLPGGDPVKESETGSFTLKPLEPELTVTIDSPSSGTQTADNQVTVTASISSDSELPEINKVGFIVNGAVQYATLSGSSFSTVAVLATGENRIKAGVLTAAGKLYYSNEIIVTSEAVNNTFQIRITWDKDDTDVDLHFSWSGGSECYYNNKTPDWGGASVSPVLDVDDTNGYGPENITIDGLPGSGSYRIWVYYYSDHDNGPTTVTAAIYKDGASVFSGSSTMSNHDSWTLMEFSVP